MKCGQSPANGGHVANTRHVQAKAYDHSGHNSDPGKRRWNGFGHPRKKINNRHCQGDQTQHGDQRPAAKPSAPSGAMGPDRHAARLFELGHLGQKDHNCQPVHKAQHHRMRHQSNELSPLHDTRKNLQQPHQNHCGKKILNPMLSHQSHHHHRQRAGRPRNHSWAATKDSCYEPNKKRCIKSNKGMDTGNKGKGYRFWHQG